jgi:cytochrome c oxidase subunit II
MKLKLLTVCMIVMLFLVGCGGTEPASTPAPSNPVSTPEPAAPVSAPEPVSTPEPVSAPEPVSTPEPTPAPVSTPEPAVKEISVTAKRFEFVPSTINVNEGDNVKLSITSEDSTHGFALLPFGVRETLSPGKTVTVEFTADKVGEHTFFCTVPCGSGHGGMKGTLVVS